MIEPTDEMVRAFRGAALADGKGIEAGLAAVLAIVERDYRVEERIQTRCGVAGPDGMTCQRSPEHDGDHGASVLNKLVMW